MIPILAAMGYMIFQAGMLYMTLNIKGNK